MNLLNPLFLIPLLTGAMFVSMGIITLKFPPKEINPSYGYRTANSMKSKERWDFAQTYASKLMIRLGAILSFTCIIGILADLEKILSTVAGLLLLISTVIILITKTEIALKNKFENTH
jgi:uncharacterized membrane protein